MTATTVNRHPWTSWGQTKDPIPQAFSRLAQQFHGNFSIVTYDGAVIEQQPPTHDAQLAQPICFWPSHRSHVVPTKTPD